MRKVPQYFQDIVQQFDRELRVKWHPEKWQYAVERRMHATEFRIRTALKEIFYGKANRRIHDGPQFTKEKIQKQLESRYEARARLNSLNDGGYRILFFFDEANGDTLNAVLYTLRSTDLWNENTKRFDPYDENALNQYTKLIAHDRYYEDDRDELSVENKRRDENRGRGAEMYEFLKLRTGSKTVV